MTVLQLANDDTVSLQQLDRLISADAAFALEVISIANSSLYAPPFPVTSILHAIAMLGSNRLRGICMTVGVRSYLGNLLRRPAMQIVWRHNLACAIVAERITATGTIDSDAAYTAGILHDVGRLALAVVNPNMYDNLLRTHTGPPESIFQGERELFGYDHCEIGNRVVEGWQMPGDFMPIVSQHHSPRAADAPWSVAEVIRISCRLADAAGFPAFQGCEATPVEQLLEALPETSRQHFPASREELKAMVNKNIRALESASRF